MKLTLILPFQRKFFYLRAFLLITLLLRFAIPGYSRTSDEVSFTVTMENPAHQTFHVVMKLNTEKPGIQNLKMPMWSPGYYQLMDYADAVSDFTAKDALGKGLAAKKNGRNVWAIEQQQAGEVTIEYDVKATKQFVANSLLDSEHGYIVPTSLFLYPEHGISRSAKVTVIPPKSWAHVATGLDKLPGKGHVFTAPDFDVLYDSPILIGNLEELPAFEVKGIPHRFIGFKMGNFDKARLMQEIKKIVEKSSELIGNIPYKHYTFLAIGPGRGGIEHLNSTTISFEGESLATEEGRLRMLSFITHEYFHHYNVKRIRPVELGPFDYDKGSKTNSLWVSEGLTVYYEYIVLNKAGLMSRTQVLDAFKASIRSFETQPGGLFQSLAQASAETWSDGPFGRTEDEFNKTISYYAKGPVVGLLLDFCIRHETGNKKSLDDVMRMLYYTYYKKQDRGFTEDELKAAIETISGKKMDDLFAYIYSTKELDYEKYFAYAGLAIDLADVAQPGGYLGIKEKQEGQVMKIVSVDYDSPAWKAGLRRGGLITQVDDAVASTDLVSPVLAQKRAGETLKLKITEKDKIREISVTLGTRTEKTFNITEKKNPTSLQTSILNSWCTR